LQLLVLSSTISNSFASQEGDLTIEVLGCDDYAQVWIKETENSKRVDCEEEAIFRHQDILPDQTFEVCANAKGKMKTVCNDGVNDESSEPESITLNFEGSE
jgi:hypothetical protein